MGWLVNKLRNGRISLAIKELKYDIDSADGVRRAKILFKAQEYRESAVGGGVSAEVFENPQKYPRDFVMETVSGFEDVIIDGQDQLNNAVTHMKNIGMDSSDLRLQMLIEKRAVQVWIASLGATEKLVPEVRNIWAKLIGSMTNLPAVYNEMAALGRLSG